MAIEYNALSKGLSNIKDKKNKLEFDTKKFLNTCLDQVTWLSANNVNLGLIGKNKDAGNFFRTKIIKGRISTMEKSVDMFNKSVNNISEKDIGLKQVYYNIIEAYSADIKYLSAFCSYLVASFIFRVKATKDIMISYKKALYDIGLKIVIEQ